MYHEPVSYARRAACVAAIVAIGACVAPARAGQAQDTASHDSHSPTSPDERALRQLLSAYGRGDIDVALSALLAKPPRWSQRALDAAVRRIEEDIEYHRRPANRLSPTRDEQLERYLRADRLQVLLLTAAMQLEAARAVTPVDTVGSFVLESERTIDTLYGLHADFKVKGSVPWPVEVDVAMTAGDRERSAEWPHVRAFVERWYSAAAARLQQLVEVTLAPALVARGLARFPAHPDLLLARGSFVETRLALSRVDASLASSLYPSDTRRRWQDDLGEAERDFERAVQASGSAGEAAVRLARVRILKGQIEPARELLNRVLAADTAGEIRYLALLFRAAAAEQTGDLPAAAGDYRTALDTLPGTRTPMLALSRIAEERNQPSEARQWAERAVAGDGRGPDPWRLYIQGQAWQLDRRMASLRTLEPH